MLKHHQTYEIMRPEDVGAGATKLVLGKHSGRHAFGTRLSELGFKLQDEELKRAFVRFKELADIKKTVTDIDLEALAADESESATDLYTLHEMQVASGTNGTPTATVSIVGPDGETHVAAAVGTGPVDAVFCAMADLLPEPLELSSYRIEGNTEGNDALGVASVRLRRPGAPVTERSFHGNGTDVDVIVASARAYLSAANSLLSSVARRAGDDSKSSTPLKGI
jgi:2-isopropylmalate synthase